MNIKKIAGLFLVEFIAVAVIGFLNVYKSFIFNSIATVISSLPLSSLFKSLLLIVVMSLPVLAVGYIVNLKFLKLSTRTLLLTHSVVVLTYLVLLELILRWFSS